ncbi:trypsin delta-like [Teleopsis dalmanni]|uniref:trypsin delta-like n=1 Tax=Teleopsis dalmanni TaxID=139649 RepID=UPI0018CE2234|nr:trypsin delta-like [Teleopsis dalmanni]
MFKLVILVSAVTCALAAVVPEDPSPQIEGRIVGGNEGNINQYPYLVSVQRNGTHICGGSIYSNKIIVTAAHCLQNVWTNELRVRAGSSTWNSGGILYYVYSYRNHEDYNPTTMENDVAVILLSTILSFSTTIAKIDLTYYGPLNGATGTVIGWGTTSFNGSISDHLRYTAVTIISPTQCGSSAYRYGSTIKSNMFCASAEGKDACQKDSGGPLIYNNFLIGIVSWGYGCAYSGYPGVYTDVAQMRSWIMKNAITV